MWLYYESLFSIYDILLLCLLFRGLAVTPSSLVIQIIWCLAALFSKDLRKKKRISNFERAMAVQIVWMLELNTNEHFYFTRRTRVLKYYKTFPEPLYHILRE